MRAAGRCGAGWSAVMSTKLLQAKRRSGVVRWEGRQAWGGQFNNAQGHVFGVQAGSDMCCRKVGRAGDKSQRNWAKPTVQVYLRNVLVTARACSQRGIVAEAPFALVMLPPAHARTHMALFSAASQVCAGGRAL